jgi:hypothetical protein
MNSETYIYNNTVNTHHGRHTQQKQIPKSNNTFAALRTIPLQNNAQYCKKVQGHYQNNLNFPSRNKISPPPTILNTKKTASWETAERQMTTRKVCCEGRKAEAGEGSKPGKTQTTCATGKGEQKRGNWDRRHTLHGIDINIGEYWRN